MKAFGWRSLSLVVNVVLLAIVVMLWRRPSGTGAGTVPMSEPGAVKVAGAPAARQIPQRGGGAVVVAGQFDWRQVESEDYRKYMANLRAINCPEETIRDIIIADVNKLFAARRTQIEVVPKEYKFWQADESRQWDDPVLRERQRKIQDLELERRALIKDLLGVDYQQETQKLIGGASVLDRMYGFLPDDKRERVQGIVERASLIEQELYQEADGDLSPEQRAKLKALRQEMRMQLAQTMTPAELEEYDLRNSPSAHVIRANLLGVELTSDEFKAVFRLRREFDEKFQDVGDGAEKDRAQQQLDDQTRALLGAGKFAEMKRAQDPDFQQLYHVTEKYQLPATAAARLYEIKRTADEYRRGLETNNQLIGEQRYAAIEAMATEVQRSVKEVLGEKGFKYLLGRGGEWMLKPGE